MSNPDFQKMYQTELALNRSLKQDLEKKKNVIEDCFGRLAAAENDNANYKMLVQKLGD